MATIDESTVNHRRNAHLLPLSPRVPSSTDRHFEQYLIDHHHLPKLPSISKQTTNRQLIEKKNSFSYRQQTIPPEFERDTGSINRLLNSEQYRRSQARLIEYRQHSKIPGVALKTTNNLNDITTNGKTEIIVPLKEVFNETTKPKQDEIDFVDDDSILSNETDRRRRAKHWIKEHQFFFTEYQ